MKFSRKGHKNFYAYSILVYNQILKMKCNTSFPVMRKKEFQREKERKSEIDREREREREREKEREGGGVHFYRWSI